MKDKKYEVEVLGKKFSFICDSQEKANKLMKMELDSNRKKRTDDSCYSVEFPIRAILKENEMFEEDGY